ncbi:MAG TPA: hypothetical protein VFI15_03770 [Candidatus Limnocylindrales bacterium]|nr:hypothetical protein [Candidatus Limnocylindrales bacterium]
MPKEPTTAEALETWRAAERIVAVARRGRLSAEAAANAAAEAAAAATATANAAKAALESMALAEQSAAKTAAAARLLVGTTRADLADSDAELALAEVDESQASIGYHGAANRAAAANRNSPEA